jgi:putative transposase
VIRPWRRLNSQSGIEVLAHAMVERGIPEHIRSDNGPMFVDQDLRKWLAS